MRATWCFLAAMLAPAVARADDPPSPEAIELFEKARDLVKAGKHTEACPLFRRSFELTAALGTELNLARCLAMTGKLVEARDIYVRLVPKTQDANQPQREALAREGLADVMGRIPRLQIDRRAIGKDVPVRVDGALVENPAAVMVDPGEHKVEAEGATTVTVTVVEQDLTSVKLEPVGVAPAGPDTPSDRMPRPRLIWGLAGGAAGSLLVGAITGIAVVRIKHAGLRHCDDSTGALACDARGGELLDHARTASHVSTVFFVAGVGLAAATAWFEWKWRRGAASPTATTASAWLAPSGTGGIAVRGAW